MNEPAPLVVLMCGLAGSGKTTYAQRLEQQGYARIGIDEEIWRLFGRYGVDYAPEEYAAKSRVAERSFDAALCSLVRSGRNVVVDSALWNRAARERCKRLVEDNGGRWQLVYLKTPPDVLRQRLAGRAARYDANAAFPITEEILEHYLQAFEEPVGEGEDVVDIVMRPDL